VLQRQSNTTFSFYNNADAGMALVTQTVVNDGSSDLTEDHLVEGYVVAASNAAASLYFHTASDTSLDVTFQGQQLTTLVLVSDTQTYSRNIGFTALNNFSGWTNPDLATPGLQNNTTPVELSVFSAE
jgi:hypothetical protein